VIHCLIITCTHTHIRSSTIRKLPSRCDRCPDKTFDTVQTKLLYYFWPSNHGRVNLPVLTESNFACHALSSTPVQPNSGNRSKIMVCWRWSLPMPPVVPAHRPVHVPPIPHETVSTSTSTQFRSGSGSNCLHLYTRGWVWCVIFLENILTLNSGYQWEFKSLHSTK
jgi:hypothetical protein